MRRRWKRTEVSERRIQGDHHMLYVEINKSVDKSSLEERATERRKCHHSRMLDYNGRSWGEMRFEGGNIRPDNELVKAEWKPTWKKVKSTLRKGVECRRVESYKTKEQQSKVFRDQEQECHLWLTQKLHPCKTSAITDMLEQMVETRSWKVA